MSGSPDAITLPRSPLGWPLVIIALFALCALWLTLICVLDPAFSTEQPAPEQWAIALRNAIPPALLTGLLWVCTRRALLSTWITMLIVCALYAANALKLDHLQTPLLPTDFRVLGNNMGGGLLLRYLPSTPRDALVFAAIALVTLGLFLEPASAWLRGRRRGIAAVAGIALTLSLLGGLKPWRVLYSQDLLEFRTWSPIESMERAGLVAGMLQYHWEFTGGTSTIDPALARDLLGRRRQSWATALPVESELPDIVVVQSESFFDPSRINGIPREGTIPHFRALSERAVHGDLFVPAFGGGTIRTEFEVLSGLAMRYFAHDDYPYFRLTDSPLPSIASVLAARGYHTVAIHPNEASFWNRATAFQSLGFDDFRTISDFRESPRDGWYVSDAALTESILKQLADDGPPRFVFAISIGAHGPYDDAPISDVARRDAISVPAELNPTRAMRLRNYLYLLQNADNALQELVTAIEQRPRRTLLLFYGDHLPALPKAYAQLGFRDGAPPGNQPVPWLLFDNAAPNRASEHVDSASFYLPGQLLRAAGILDDPYFLLTEDIRAQTRFKQPFTPAEDAGLAALMQLRQRSQDKALIEALAPPQKSGACAADSSC
jgi:hypothetical protein